MLDSLDLLVLVSSMVLSDVQTDQITMTCSSEAASTLCIVLKIRTNDLEALKGLVSDP